MKRGTILAVLEKVTVRNETLNGKSYLVAPVVLLAEGVHHGSGGEVYYSPQILETYVETWNGVPLPVDHPISSDGAPLSANSPEIEEKQNIGKLYGVYYDTSNQKIRGEVWIDVDKAGKVQPAIVSLIRNGGHLEVSTGMYFTTDNTPGEWNGEKYDGAVIDMRPDHLALLLDNEGACSWADGCGVRNNTSGEGLINVKSTARTPSFDGTESTSWESVKKTFSAYRDGYYKAKGNKPDNTDEIPGNVAKAPSAMKSWIASKTLLGEASADNERDLIFFPAVNPSTNKLNEGALRAVIGGRGSQAKIPQAAITSAQNKARSLLNKHFDAELEVNTILFAEEKTRFGKLLDNVVRLGKWILRTNEMSHDDIRDSVRAALRDNIPGKEYIWVKELFDSYVIYEISDMDARGSERIWKRSYSIDKESGKVTLGDDAIEVKEETNYLPVENVGDKETEPADNKSVNVKEDVMKVEEIVKALIANDRTKYTDEDKEWLTTLSEDQLTKMEPTEEKKEPVETKPEANTKKIETNDAGGDPPKEPEKVMTVEEYVKTAPPKIANSLIRMLANDKAAEDRLVKSILENKQNEFTEESLRLMEIEDLVKLNKIAGNAVDANYELQGGGNAPDTNKDNEVPEPPKAFGANSISVERAKAK